MRGADIHVPFTDGGFWILDRSGECELAAPRSDRSSEVKCRVVVWSGVLAACPIRHDLVGRADVRGGRPTLPV